MRPGSSMRRPCIAVSVTSVRMPNTRCVPFGTKMAPSGKRWATSRVAAAGMGSAALAALAAPTSACPCDGGISRRATNRAAILACATGRRLRRNNSMPKTPTSRPIAAAAASVRSRCLQARPQVTQNTRANRCCGVYLNHCRWRWCGDRQRPHQNVKSSIGNDGDRKIVAAGCRDPGCGKRIDTRGRFRAGDHTGWRVHLDCSPGNGRVGVECVDIDLQFGAARYDNRLEHQR